MTSNKTFKCDDGEIILTDTSPTSGLGLLSKAREAVGLTSKPRALLGKIPEWWGGLIG